ncbi:MAG: hypothetical protein EXR07_08500 [Acetobacteraceae bacterium]|nr:hypothetical protein [Acetobacteraceae bacterium]
MRDAAFIGRARRLAEYVGGIELTANDAILARLAGTLLRPDPNDSPVRWAEYRALVERPRFAAVFTAHPTFALPLELGHALAEAASGRASPSFPSHRRSLSRRSSPMPGRRSLMGGMRSIGSTPRCWMSPAPPGRTGGRS